MSSENIVSEKIVVPYNLDEVNIFRLSADRVGLTETCKRWVASIQNFKGSHPYVSETPKEITQYIEKRMEELKMAGEFNVVRTKEYLPEQNKSVPGFSVQWKKEYCPNPEYSDITVRIVAWHPFPIMFYPNFNRILKQMCDKDDIPYIMPEEHDNAFEEIGINRLAFTKLSLMIMDIRNLNEKFIWPFINKVFPEYSNSFSYSCTTINQLEAVCDIPKGSEHEVNKIIYNWSINNMDKFQHSKLECDGNKRIFHFTTDDGLRFKMYSKGRILRMEFTYDRKYMDAHGISRYEFKEVFKRAEEDFEELDKVTDDVNVKEEFPTEDIIKRLKKMTSSGKDIKVLESLSHRGLESFKNETLQKDTSLTRNMIYYRLKYKFSWLLVKSRRKWKIKPTMVWVLKKFLQTLNEIQYYITEITIGHPISNHKICGVPVTE